MTVKDYCDTRFFLKYGVKESRCPAQEKPELCRFGKMCWITNEETTEEIEEDISIGYGLIPQENSSTN